MRLPSLTLPSDRHMTFHHCHEHLLWRGEEATPSIQLTLLLLCYCQTAARSDVGVTRPHVCNKGATSLPLRLRDAIRFVYNALNCLILFLCVNYPSRGRVGRRSVGVPSWRGRE